MVYAPVIKVLNNHREFYQNHQNNRGYFRTKPVQPTHGSILHSEKMRAFFKIVVSQRFLILHIFSKSHNILFEHQNDFLECN